MIFVLAALSGFSAHADDSVELSRQRLSQLAKSDIYCPIGRGPLQWSAAALLVKPSAMCRFSSILDTRLNPLRLQPPVLNPQLAMEELRAYAKRRGAEANPESGGLRLKLPDGPALFARALAAKAVDDPLIRLNAYPREWGGTFVSLEFRSPQDVQAFVAWAEQDPAGPLFWENPHAAAEEAVRPRLESGARAHHALKLLSKCAAATAPPETGRSLWLVGDMHREMDVRYLAALVRAQRFAWVALETTRDREPELNLFLSARTPADEEPALNRLLERKSKDTREAHRDLLRVLKLAQVPLTLMDYHEAYFNFPFTNTAWHGLMIAARNRLWVDRLPATWSGRGVVFAGLGHFTDTPGADFQDFMAERAPGVEMLLINPLEECESLSHVNGFAERP